MKFIKSIILAVAVALASVGCTRIETGEVWSDEEEEYHEF